MWRSLFAYMADNLSEKENSEKIKSLAERVLALARDEILMSFRFLSRSLMELKCEPRFGIGDVRSDMGKMYYDPVFILKASSADF